MSAPDFSLILLTKNGGELFGEVLAAIQKLRGIELDTADRNIERALYLRRHLGRGDAPSEKN